MRHRVSAEKVRRVAGALRRSAIKSQKKQSRIPMAKKTLEHHAPYGGQAVIEGVMMRSPRFFAIACRKPNNEIVVKQEPVESYLKNFMWMNIPFLRGTLALIDSMAMGMKALTFSADVAMEEPPTTDESSKPESDSKKKKKPAKAQSGSISDIAIGSTLIFGLLLGILIFVVLPQVAATRLEKQLMHPWWLNIAEGLIRIVFFVTYIALISRMKDIQRVFMYHGAEHKVINTYEAGLPLTKENFDKYTTIHPRCGTSFITFVLILSIIVFSVVLGWHPSIMYRIVTRLILLPVIAGIGYEMIKLVGRHKDSKILNLVLAPGLWLQKLTTNEPTDDQVEVALRALQAVMGMEEEYAKEHESASVSA